MSYWILEYVKVFFAYLFVTYLWPTVVFRKYLAGKNRIFRFSFCSIVSVLLYYTVIILLGLVHLLNSYLVWLLFYGVFFIQLFRGYQFSDETKKHFRYFVEGTMKPKSYVIDVWNRSCLFVKTHILNWWNSLYGIKAECFLLVLIVIYGMLYFGYATYSAHSFGFPDLYVHHSWVYGLRIGKIFYRGIYPEAMHCFAYLLSVVFNINTYSILVYLGAVHIMTILVSCYIYFKELLKWKYSPHIVLILFLLVETFYLYTSVSYARMQCSLPQEFAMGGQMLIPAFLLRYLKSTQRTRIKKKKLKFYFEENLIIFILALTETIVVHFYGTGMAFYLCVPIAFIYLNRVFNWRRFIPLAFSVITAVLIAIIPMALAFAEGIPLQGSIGWGINVIQGFSALPTSKTILSIVGLDRLAPSTYSSASILNAFHGLDYAMVIGSLEKFINDWKFYLYVLRWGGYYTIFSDKMFYPIVYAHVVAGGMGGIIHIALYLMQLVKKEKNDARKFDSYVILPLTELFYVFMYIAPLIGGAQLIERNRLLVMIQMIGLSLFIVPVDFIAFFVQKHTKNWVNSMIGVLVGALTVMGVCRLNLYHSNMHYELARYNSNVDVTSEIVKTFPKDHFTIVSTTDELYQINEYGFHEEMLDFIWSQLDSHFTIPTPYIFIYVEKHSIWRGQHYQFMAPDWLADSSKESLVPIDAKEPEPAYTEISEELAQKPRPDKKMASRAASDRETRAVMNAKMQEWVSKFKVLHPNDISVFYEDEEFVCYMITQNPARLFELSLR